MKKVGFVCHKYSKYFSKILVFTLLLNAIGLCQKIEDGWKGIKPFKTDKSTVENILGKPEIDDNGYYGYKTDEAYIRVNYSTEPCQKNQFERGKYKIPKDVVLDYTVNLKKLTLLSEFKIKLEGYDKDTSGDVMNNADYRNFDLGVAIGVYIQEGTEYVTDIKFSPGKQDAEIFKCEGK